MNHGLSEVTVERSAKQTYRPGSDIDLTLCGDELDHTLLTRISNELDDLLLPYQIDLSLMALLSHPALLDHISRVGVVLYAKSSAPLEACGFENQSE